LLGFGHFANVLPISESQAIALSTDGIGTKAIVAQMLDKYDTIGIDCVAMNANDILCVGAEPVAMVDYIAVETANARLLSEIAKGLAKGAELANIVVPGGEISQIEEIIKSERPGYGFDLVGTCIGIVDPSRLITGERIEPGDVVIGLASTGIHSNGLTLARKTFFEDAGLTPNSTLPGLKRTLGEELLEPTRIYVPEVMQMLREELDIKALVHITSDGFLNLARVSHDVGFEIDYLPSAPAIFSHIQRYGDVTESEMFTVYNMGIGFCVVAAPESAPRVLEIAESRGYRAWRVGHCAPDERKRVWIQPMRLVGEGGVFSQDN
jgi:phosphoribosylformylglycinamidine cyclo-ligase